jgi:hypothetical protein
MNEFDQFVKRGLKAKHYLRYAETKKRMLKNLFSNSSEGVRAFYLGLSSHGNTYKIIKNLPQS